MTLAIETRTVVSGDIAGSKFTVTFGEYEKVAEAQAEVATAHSGDIIKVDNIVISGNVVDVHVLRQTPISGNVNPYTVTSGSQISGAVATVIADCI